MDLSYTPEEEAFRARVRQWIADNAPKSEGRRDLDALRAWQRRLHQGGYLGAGWPKEYGGAGFSPMEQSILNEELARVNAPGPINAMALWWVGPAIIKYGTEEQKKRFLAPILTADEIWATGYSEPGSGSDMAAAKCKAERDGDDYVVNGQKVWTTIAHISDWYFVLVRTSTRGAEVGRAEPAAHRSQVARNRGAADPADHRRQRVQRGVPPRRARAGRQSARGRKGRVGRW